MAAGVTFSCILALLVLSSPLLQGFLFHIIDGPTWIKTCIIIDGPPGSCSANPNTTEVNMNCGTGGDGLPACEGLEGGNGEEDNPLLLMSEELFHASPISRLPGPISGCGSERNPGAEMGRSIPLALPPPPSMSDDLRIAMEQVEEAYKGNENVTKDNGCLSKGEVKDILTKAENFMETQACDTAMKLGVSFDGVDKGLKNSMLLIKRRWMADMARKAKADMAGKVISEDT